MGSIRKLHVLAVISTALISESVCSAGKQSLPDIDSLPKIEVTSESVSTGGMSASSGIVVSEQIESRPLSRVGELLETVPGLIVTQHSGEGKANQYFLRGFNLDHGTDMATFIDGMPVNLRTHGHGQGYTDVNFIIPEMIESLEYKKGPSFFNEGDFANAGVMRLHTKSSMDGTQLKLGVGENGFRRGFIASGGDDWVFAIDGNQYDGPWTVAQGLEKFSVFAKKRFGDFLNGQAISFMGYDNTWTATDQLPLRYVEAGGDSFDSLDEDSGGTTSRYSVNFEDWRSIDGKGLTSSLYLTQYKMDLYSNYTYFTNGLSGDEFYQNDDRTIVGGAMNYEFLQNHMGDWTLAMDLRHDDVKDVALSTTQDRQIDQRLIRHKVSETGLGIAINNDYKWSDRFVTAMGLRWDYLQADVENKLNGETFSKSDDLFSPKFNARYKFNESVYGFVNYGWGYHSNDARGFAEGNVNNTQEKATVFARSKGGDLGLQVRLNESLETALSLWWLELESELIFVGDEGTTEASDESKRHGVEASLFWQPYKWLIVDGDVAWTKARLHPTADAEQYIPGAIEQVVSIGLSVNDAGPWNGGLRLRHFGEFALNEDNSQRADAVTMVNGEIGYSISHNLNVSLLLLNLTNEVGNDITYLYESQLIGEASSVEDVHFHPIEARSVRMELGYRF